VHVVHTERDVVAAEQIDGVRLVRLCIAEFDRVPQRKGRPLVTRATRERLDKGEQTFGIWTPPRRKLIEDGTERRSEFSGARDQQIERRVRLAQALQVRQITTGLDREEKPVRHRLAPARELPG
jgi:hypothetical protein